MELIFIIIIGLLIIFENRLYRTFFTPFSIISIIHLILILLNNYVGVKFGFYKIDYISIAYIMWFLILIFLISIIFYFLIIKKKVSIERNIEFYIQNVLRKKNIIVILFIIGIVAKYISLLQAISMHGFSNIKGGATGIFAHIGNLGLVMTPYLLILYKNNKKKLTYLLLIVLMYINLFIFGGKYGIIIAIMHLIIVYAITNNVRTFIAIRLGLSTIVIGVLIFIIIYAINPIISNGYFDKTSFLVGIHFSIRHFLFYLLSPIIATNYYFNNPGTGGLQVLFTVPINICKAIYAPRNYINPINQDFVPISNIHYTNVGGLFAETVYQTNFLIASIYISLFFCFVYYYFNISRYRGSMISFSSLLLAIVSMMFFSNFLTVSGVVLQIILLWFIETIFSKKIVINKTLN